MQYLNKRFSVPISMSDEDYNRIFKKGVKMLLIHRDPLSLDLPEGYSLRLIDEGEDVEKVCTLIRKAFPEEKRSLQELVDYWHRSGEIQETYLAIHDGQIVATASLALAHGEFFLHWVATHEDHRGKGLGRALAKMVLASGPEQIFAHVQPASQKNVEFYQSLGFEELKDVVMERKEDEQRDDEAKRDMAADDEGAVGQV